MPVIYEEVHGAKCFLSNGLPCCLKREKAYFIFQINSKGRKLPNVHFAHFKCLFFFLTFWSSDKQFIIFTKIYDVTSAHDRLYEKRICCFQRNKNVKSY